MTHFSTNFIYKNTGVACTRCLIAFVSMASAAAQPPAKKVHRTSSSDTTVVSHVEGVDNPAPHCKSAPRAFNGDNLVIVMVGLPARGKSYIAQKLQHYLAFFHGMEGQIFNAGQYRRKLFGAQQDASFFDFDNAAGAAARETCITAAMNDLKAWVRPGNGRIGFFDATNSTKVRRQWVMDQLAGNVAVHNTIFVESICNGELSSGIV